MHEIQSKIINLASKEDISALGYRKLGKKIGVDHPQKVKHHLQKLIENGNLIKTPFGVLKVTKPNKFISQIFDIPVLGQANCGQALSFAENTKWGVLTLTPSLLPNNLNPKNLFAVRATGDSMNKANINGSSIEDGDYVIIDNTVQIPHNKDYVVSSIGGLANIKQYIRDEANQLIRLVSQSTKIYPPIVIDPNDIDSYFIHGKVIKVIKT